MKYNELGKFINYRRNKLNTSLNKFALENNIEPAALSRMENLKQGIKIDTLFKIAKGFQMTPAELLTEFEKTYK